MRSSRLATLQQQWDVQAQASGRPPQQGAESEQWHDCREAGQAVVAWPDLSEAAGPHGAGVQGEADLLQHVRVGGHPAQAHAGSQKLAEAVQPHHPAVHIHRQVAVPQPLQPRCVHCNMGHIWLQLLTWTVCRVNESCPGAEQQGANSYSTCHPCCMSNSCMCTLLQTGCCTRAVSKSLCNNCSKNCSKTRSEELVENAMTRYTRSQRVLEVVIGVIFYNNDVML